MKVEEIMTADPECVTPQDSLSQAARIMRDADVGLVPVVEDAAGRRLRGVITDRDIAVRHVAEKHLDDCRVMDHMSRDIAKARPGEAVEAAMERMRERKIRRIPVVDEDDRLVGIVAQADIALEVGRDHPEEVEEFLARVSEPGEPE